MTLTCRCAAIRHAIASDDRSRTRRAFEAARSAGNQDLADFEQARLDQCPTSRLTVQERPA